MKKSTFVGLSAVFSILFISCRVSTGEDVTPNTASGSQPTAFIETEKDGVTAVTVKDYGMGTGDKFFTNNKIWFLDGLVFVNDGQTLMIEAGTIIKGKSGQGSNASALIVARGGRIIAEGTASAPIIFTSEYDDLSPELVKSGTFTTGNKSLSDRGEWGGIIILGRSTLNSTGNETAVEGIPTSDKRGLYGGIIESDNSGTLKYISIRHGGTDIGAGNEINGLTLGGVGSGTTIEYIEVIANKDDGFEFFGGTVNTKYLISAYCGDDAFDYDEGWRGNNQFWLAYQDPNAGDRGGEHDGGTNPETDPPYATPVIYNATFYGRGEGAGKRALTFRDNAGGEYHNSIFTEYGKGIDIEDLAEGEDSKNRLETGDLKLQNILFWKVAGNDPAKCVVSSDQNEGADLSGNQFVLGLEVYNPNFNSVLIPASEGVKQNLSALPDGDFFDNQALYKGAFDPNNSKAWFEGWTLLNVSGTLQQ